MNALSLTQPYQPPCLPAGKSASTGNRTQPLDWKSSILATELSTLTYEKPSTGFEPVTSRLLSECSAN